MGLRITRWLSLLAIWAVFLALLPAAQPVAGQGPAEAFRVFLPIVSHPQGHDPDPSRPPQEPAPPPGFLELPWGRDANSQIFVGQQDGREVLLFKHYLAPIFYRDSTGSWKLIDTRLTGDAGQGYRNTAGPYAATFTTTPGRLVQISRPDATGLSIGLPGATIARPTIAGDTITYPTVALATDLVYQAMPWGVKEDVVLHGPEAAPTFTLTLDTGNATIVPQTDGGWHVQSPTGALLWRILPPQGMDAAGVPAPLTMQVSPLVPGRYQITLNVEPAWLSAPERAFPVRLDPSIADPQYITGDTYVQSGFPDTASANQRALFLGYNTLNNRQITRIYTTLDLSFLEGVGPESIVSAELRLSQYVQESRAGYTTSLYPVLAPWNPQTLTWRGNERLPIGPRISGYTVPASPNLLTDHRAGWDIVTWLREVRAGRQANYGLTIRADNELAPGGVFHSHSCVCDDGVNELPQFQVVVALDSDLRPALDTWGFDNQSGTPSFEQFVADYGMPVTTHIITETRTLQVLNATMSISLPISFEPAGYAPTLPLTPTAGLTVTLPPELRGALVAPRPIAHAVEETIVSALFDDAFIQDYLAAIEGGLCAGMAAGVAEHYAGLGPGIPDLGGTNTLRSVPPTDQVMNYIEQLHGRQISSQMLNWVSGPGQTDAIRLYNDLAARIATLEWRQNPLIIGIRAGADCANVELGHALLPYKVVPLPGSLARIYVYDPNHPPTTDADTGNRYIQIDLATNTWSYELLPATATRPAVLWQGQNLVTMPLAIYREAPVLPTQSDTDILAVSGGQRAAWGGQRAAWGGHAALFGGQRAAWGGDPESHTGCIPADGGFRFVQEISRTTRVVPYSGWRNDQAFPDTLFFPAGQEWSFTGAGSLPGNVGDLLLFGPHALAGMLSVANSTTRDTVTMDAAFQTMTVTTSDAPKLVTAYQMHETDDWTRVYAVSNTMLGSDEQLILLVAEGGDSFTVINQSPITKTVDLGFGHIGGDGVSTVIYHDQVIGPGARLVLTPMQWERVQRAPIVVELDTENDGVIDDTWLLGGDILPAAVASANVPSTPGQVLSIIDWSKTVAAGNHHGWVNLDHPLPPGVTDARGIYGDGSDLRRWLAEGARPELQAGGRLVGIANAYYDLFTAISVLTPGSEQAYKLGDVILMPIYDRIYPARGRQPLTYRISGLAVVRIVTVINSDGQVDCAKIRGELLMMVPD